MMPMEPHHKTRSLLQIESIEALLDVPGGAALVPELADRIEDWRRALAYGKLAASHARTGDVERAREHLATAEELEARITKPEEQGWRRGSVKVAIAEAYAYLGSIDRTARIQGEVGEVEAGQIAILASKLIDESAIDAQLELLESIAANGSMDQVDAALNAVAEFYGRLYDQPERRDLMESKIRGAWNKLPLQKRMELLERLVQFDLENGNRDKARATVDDIEAMVVGHEFNGEEQIAFRAAVASLRAQCGDREAGIEVADDALTMFDENRERITNMFRGEALRPLAAAYVELGETMTANDLFERALVEAVENPNSRPRAQDLVRTCTAIVACGLEPRESLMKALAATKAELGEPW
jgi:hypothetical protein